MQMYYSNNYGKKKLWNIYIFNCCLIIRWALMYVENKITDNFLLQIIIIYTILTHLKMLVECVQQN